MANRCTRIPEIMFPREGVDLSKWAVIACDQYTSCLLYTSIIQIGNHNERLRAGRLLSFNRVQADNNAVHRRGNGRVLNLSLIHISSSENEKC